MTEITLGALKRLLARPVFQLQLVAFVLLSCIPVALVTTQLHRVAWDNAWRDATDKHQLLAASLVGPISNYVGDHRDLLASLATGVSSAMRGKEREDSLKPVLSQAFSELSGFSSVAVLNQDGDVLGFVRAPGTRGAIPTSLHEEPCFANTLRSAKPEVSGVKQRPFSPKPTVMVAHPLMDAKGEVTAVILGELTLDRIETFRASIQFGELGHSMIVDHRGRVVAHPNPEWTANAHDLSHLPIVQNAIDGRSGVTEFFSPHLRRQMVAGYTPVPDLGWGILVPQPKQEIETQLHGLLRPHYYWTALGLVVAIVLAVLLARWITAPINRLAAAVKGLREGDPNAALPSPSDVAPAEVQRLGATFSSLLQDFEVSRADAAKRNRALEAHVLRSRSDLRKANRRAEKLATRDYLTTLYNRRYFEHRLGHVIDTTSTTSPMHAVLYIDVDQFKIINDNCGYPGGDQLLCEIAKRLLEHVRENDVVARVGGDEFAVLLVDTTGDRARALAQRIRRAFLRNRFTWKDRRFNISVSIGVVTVRPDHGVTETLQAADASCASAKELGRDRVVYYEPDNDQIQRRRGESRWMARLNRALDEDRFELFAQPIVGIADVTDPHHYEVLLRLRSRSGRYILPNTFLPAAERYGLIQRVDRWVVRSTIQFITENSDTLPMGSRLFVNLSAQSLVDQQFAAYVCDVFAKSPGLAERISFEVTETAAIGNLPQAISVMSRIRETGCKFALDDFGTGMSSFEYLKELPVDMIKIDGSFIENMLKDNADFAIVKAVNSLGKSMGMQTVAESVSDTSILAKVKELGVDFAQGYAFAHPQPMIALGEAAESMHRLRHDIARPVAYH
ncbi:MAG: EAL domain-containing protein [Gammaproteobacteria bacterium]|nr:EAL domain-containing protein [Gammaproteobacteria bacterium]